MSYDAQIIELLSMNTLNELDLRASISSFQLLHLSIFVMYNRNTIS